MELLAFIGKGTPLLLLAIIILQVYQSVTAKYLRDGINEIKNGITWKDTCDGRHKEIDRRLDKLEKKVFNGNG